MYVTKDEDNSDNLTDGNPDTYWETDGGVGMHWIKINMKPATVIRYVCLCGLVYKGKGPCYAGNK